ncbi:hypothetical protein [Azovibrio restrictus]|uniref:hypothetical protein n=1 Tax=Azovibrio restrictus TaxID=146938 RepID=UPI003CCBD417
MRLIALGNQNGEQSDFVYDAQDNLVRDGDDARALCKNLQPADSAARTRASFSRHALKEWQNKKPELFKKRVYNQAGLNRYAHDCI